VYHDIYRPYAVYDGWLQRAYCGLSRHRCSMVKMVDVTAENQTAKSEFYLLTYLLASQRIRIDIEIFPQYRIDIVSKSKKWHWSITNANTCSAYVLNTLLSVCLLTGAGWTDGVLTSAQSCTSTRPTLRNSYA